jgi:hypothetical protein
MIVDYKVFEKIKNTNNKLPNLLHMMEQTPHRIVYHDISNYLYEHQYFGSFNRAFLDETKNDLHMSLVKHLYGKKFGYTGSSRAKILKSLNEKVNDITSLKNILRYNGFRLNNFPNDPSAINPGEGISARYDLDHGSKNLSGGIDCKVTNYELAKDLAAIAISGPTNENNHNLSTFDWTLSGDSQTSRVGVPLKFNFPYVLMSPKTLCCDNQSDIFSFQ